MRRTPTPTREGPGRRVLRGAPLRRAPPLGTHPARAPRGAGRPRDNAGGTGNSRAGIARSAEAGRAPADMTKLGAGRFSCQVHPRACRPVLLLRHPSRCPSPHPRPEPAARAATAPPGRTATSVQGIGIPASATWRPSAGRAGRCRAGKKSTVPAFSCPRTCGRREPDRQGKNNFGDAVPGTAARAAATAGAVPGRLALGAVRIDAAKAAAAGPPSAKRWRRMRLRTPRADQSGPDGRSSRPSPTSTSRSCATAERTPSAAGGRMSAAGCTCRCSSPTPIRRWRACSGTPADHRAETVRFRPPRRHKETYRAGRVP